MLTVADIQGRKVVDAMHIDYTRNSHAWMGSVEGVPRRRAATIGGGVMTLETALELTMANELKPQQKHSLRAQIQEVDYELEQREKVYPRLARKEKYRAGELDLHVDRMKAIRATLRWVQANEADVRAFVEAKIAERAKPEGEAA